jgi:arginyl-tRNA synthetase
MGSKRDGQYLLLKEDFVDKIGQDAARWYFLNSDPSNHTTINVAKAAEQNMNNPVFYVQYAHARFCRILSKSNDLNVTIGNQFINLHLNSSKEATNLILKLDMYSDVVSRAAIHLNPQLVKIYLYELAQLMHIFYENDRLIYQNKENWLAGLYLVKTASNVLKDGLNLLGISAPEHMAPSDCE